MDKPIYTINNLIYKNNKEVVLNIKNFEFHRGAFYMFNGDMSSGKTLILNILTNGNNKFNGDVRYEDKLINSLSNRRYSRDFAYVKQLPSRPFFKTVKEYIKSNIKRYNDFDKVDKLADNIITVMDIKYIKNKKIRDLSPGQLRWVDLAAKIGSYPKVLFIDEIEQHLSSQKIKILSKILFRKCNYDGITIIASTQNKEQFSSLISVNININHGRITSVRSLSKKKKSKHYKS